jgi:acetoacetate decarboxylase
MVFMPLLYPLRQIGALLPDHLQAVVLPGGATVGGIYIAAYREGSTIQYNELIIAPALVRSGLRPGAWVSHIYVDSPQSLFGGREIWALPKEMARFETIASGSGFDVYLEQRLILTMEFVRRTGAIRLPVVLPAYGHGPDTRFFVARGNAAIGLGRATVRIPEESPFRDIGDREGPILYSDDLHLWIDRPVALNKQPG